MTVKKLTLVARNGGIVYIAAVLTAILTLSFFQGRFLPRSIRYALPLIVMVWPSLAMGIYLVARRWSAPLRIPVLHCALIGAAFGVGLISLSVTADLATVTRLTRITCTSPVSNEIDLTWPPVPHADYYEIYRSDSALHPLSEIQQELWPHAQPGVNGFTDFEGLKPSTTYHYGISAVLSDHREPVGVIAASTNGGVVLPIAGPEREEPPPTTDGSQITRPTLKAPSSWESTLVGPLMHLIPFILLPIVLGEVLVRLSARRDKACESAPLAPRPSPPMIPAE